MTMTTPQISIRLVGYQVRTLGGASVVGEVEGVRERGLRIHKIPGHRGHHGYLPAETITWISDATNTIFLGDGLGAESVVDAPPPPGADPDGWHKSNEWWADLLGHYGLYESEGRGSEPFLHSDRR
jgi:hypothetical protein